MTFIPVAIYDLDGNFQGYAVKGEHKLQSTNIYTESEADQLNEQLARLNTDLDLRKFWPHPQDPDVVALLDDENYMPIAYREAQVIDEENSYYVFKQVAGEDENGPAWVDGIEVDEQASVIVYKTAKVPEKPTDVMWRIKKASEQVARQRAGLL